MTGLRGSGSHARRASCGPTSAAADPQQRRLLATVPTPPARRGCDRYRPRRGEVGWRQLYCEDVQVFSASSRSNASHHRSSQDLPSSRMSLRPSTKEPAKNLAQSLLAQRIPLRIRSSEDGRAPSRTWPARSSSRSTRDGRGRGRVRREVDGRWRRTSGQWRLRYHATAGAEAAWA